jgi:dienelactone hydrolase
MIRKSVIGIIISCVILCFASLGLCDDTPSVVLKGGFHTFRTAVPDSVQEWEKRKVELRKTLWRLLGDMPPIFTPQPQIDSRQHRDGYSLEHLTFDNGIGDTVYGYMMIPDGHTGRGPAILYNHYHGGKYNQGKEEVLIKAFGPSLDLIPAEELVRAGYVILCIDMYAFGERKHQGPAGDSEKAGDKTEQAIFKTFLWEGRTLWGMMVRDDLLALNYLAGRAEVDPNRIATMGMSLGSTMSWWLAAMDERVKAVISVACLTRYQNIIANGGINAHGIYYFVPDMLKEKIDSESVVGLIAPRPHLTLTGDKDETSPADGVQIINDFQRHLYKLYEKEENFRGVIYPGVVHSYTPEMWQETILWLKKHL